MEQVEIFQTPVKGLLQLLWGFELMAAVMDGILLTFYPEQFPGLSVSYCHKFFDLKTVVSDLKCALNKIVGDEYCERFL